jgi:hypothetical protein
MRGRATRSKSFSAERGSSPGLSAPLKVRHWLTISEAAIRPHYNFIVRGSGSSDSVVARRLAENAEVSVLLLEAGGSDDMPSIMQAGQWPLNLGSERDWAFVGQPNPHRRRSGSHTIVGRYPLAKGADAVRNW